MGFLLQWLLLWSTGPRACGLQYLWCICLVALHHVVSSQSRDQTCVPCIARQILNHWTTRQVLMYNVAWQLCQSGSTDTSTGHPRDQYRGLRDTEEAVFLLKEEGLAGVRPKEGRTGRRVRSRGVTTAVGAPGHLAEGRGSPSRLLSLHGCSALLCSVEGKGLSALLNRRLAAGDTLGWHDELSSDLPLCSLSACSLSYSLFPHAHLS